LTPKFLVVMPVKTGIHCAARWVLAFAGTTVKQLKIKQL